MKVLTGCLTVLCVGGAAMVLGEVLFHRCQPPYVARRTLCRSNMQQLAQAVTLYAADFDNQLPSSATWTPAVSHYVKHPSALKCPEAPSQAGSYNFNPYLSRVAVERIPEPQTLVMLFEPELRHFYSKTHNDHPDPNTPKGRNVAYADGHVKYWPPPATLHLEPIRLLPKLKKPVKPVGRERAGAHRS